MITALEARQRVAFALEARYLGMMVGRPLAEINAEWQRDGAPWVTYVSTLEYLNLICDAGQQTGVNPAAYYAQRPAHRD